MMQVFGSREALSGAAKNDEKSNTREKTKKDRSKLQEGVRRRLVSDCFDLFIPGHVTGWISTNMATVGFATVVSTVLSSKDIWVRLSE